MVGGGWAWEQGYQETVVTFRLCKPYDGGDGGSAFHIYFVVGIGGLADRRLSGESEQLSPRWLVWAREEEGRKVKEMQETGRGGCSATTCVLEKNRLYKAPRKHTAPWKAQQAPAALALTSRLKPALLPALLLGAPSSVQSILDSMHAAFTCWRGGTRARRDAAGEKGELRPFTVLGRRE